MKKRELYWFLSTIGLAVIFTILLFGLDGFDPDSTFDINIHDTYLVISNIQFVALIFVFTFFGVYAFRLIRRSFKNFVVNIIAMVFTVLMLLVLDGFASFLDIFSLPYDTIGNNVPTRELYPAEQMVATISKVIRCIQFVLLIFLAYCGFRAGRNYKPKK